jgi:hypothetical protein
VKGRERENKREGERGRREGGWESREWEWEGGKGTRRERERERERERGEVRVETGREGRREG